MNKSMALPSWIPWAAAAGFALIAAGAAQLYLTSRSEAESLRDEQALAATALKSIGNQLEAERIISRQQLVMQGTQSVANLKITTLAPATNGSQALAIAIWNPVDQQGVLKVEKLPALPADRSYQLWIIDPQYPDPVDGGVFTVDSKTGGAHMPFTAKRPIKAIKTYAITQEQKNGVTKPAGPFLLLGEEPPSLR